VFSAKEEEGEFHTLFACLEDNRQKLFKYFKMGILKFENFKELLLTDSQKKNTEKKICKITV